MSDYLRFFTRPPDRIYQPLIVTWQIIKIKEINCQWTCQPRIVGPSGQDGHWVVFRNRKLGIHYFFAPFTSNPHEFQYPKLQLDNFSGKDLILRLPSNKQHTYLTLVLWKLTYDQLFFYEKQRILYVGKLISEKAKEAVNALQ